MARIRTIKPDFWTDETLGECSPTTRLLFIGIWSHADDHGNLERSSKQLRAQVFPYDTLECEPLVQELISRGLLIEYERQGKNYLHVPGFAEHQKIEKKSLPKFPPYDDSVSSRGALPEPSPWSSGSSLGREGNTDRADVGSPDEEQPSKSGSPVFAELKNLYPKRSGSHRWQDAESAFKARIREGHQPEEILEGVKRYAAFVRQAGNEGSSFVQQAATFLGKNMGFMEEWKPEKKMNGLVRNDPYRNAI